MNSITGTVVRALPIVGGLDVKIATPGATLRMTAFDPETRRAITAARLTGATLVVGYETDGAIVATSATLADRGLPSAA